jgi:membrane complex biogenesis BtpA family protein
MQNKLFKIFNKDKDIIIGAIHFAPLLGYKDFPGHEVVLKNAIEDLKAFQNGGVDGVIIENNYDIPHKINVDNEAVDLMIKLGKEIKKQVKVPMGVSVLWNDYKSALSIAREIGAKFIRVPVFVDSVRTNYGEIFANPKKVINFRKEIGVENIALFTDIHVKHAVMLENKTINESAFEAIKSGSDALIITGKWTGDAPDLSDLKAVRKTVGDFPILVGSGANINNIKDLLKYANGAIASTSLKEGGVIKNEINIKGWTQRIDKKKVEKLVNK